MDNVSTSHALPSGFELVCYKIKDILGQGGFGITYLATDENLNRSVAIKEFMPLEFVTRDLTDSSIKLVAKDKQEIFEWGLDRFRKEAQILAHFKHPNIVQVLSLFDENNTAYMVMEYENGTQFGELLEKKCAFSEPKLVRIVLPILDGLKRIHDKGFIHRDIKPSNIYIRSDNSPVLLDFGSARESNIEKTSSLTSLVTHGYAPFEQYNMHGGENQQGPWTDIYSLAATLYHAITGKKPKDAMSRATAILGGEKDPYECLASKSEEYIKYSPNFLRAIDTALNFKAHQRPQSVDAWLQMLSNKEKLTKPPRDASSRAKNIATDTSSDKPVKKINDIKNQVSRSVVPPFVSANNFLRKGAILAGAVVSFTLLTFGILQIKSGVSSHVSQKPLNEQQITQIKKAQPTPDSVPTLKVKPKAYSRGARSPKKFTPIEQLEEKIARLENTKLSHTFKLLTRYQLYRDILKIEPYHFAALDGIREIHRDVAARAEEALDRGKLKAAQENLNLLKQIDGPEDSVKKIASEIKKQEPIVVTAKPKKEKAVVAKKSKPKRKAAQVKPKYSPSFDAALKQVEKFNVAFELGDIRAIEKLAQVSKKNKRFLSLLYYWSKFLRASSTPRIRFGLNL